MLKRLSHVESQRQEYLDKKQREEEETIRAHADKRSVIIKINNTVQGLKNFLIPEHKCQDVLK